MDDRHFARANVKWPVSINTDNSSRDGVTINLSPSGAYIQCGSPLRLNEVFDLTIDVPDSDWLIEAKAEVVFSNIYGPDDNISPRGMGVRFVEISSEARKFIARAAQNYLKSKEVAPELLQTLETLVIEIDKAKSRAA